MVTQLPMFPKPSLVGWIMPFPHEGAHSILGTYEYITSYSKRDFEVVIKLSNLKWGDYSELSGRDLCNHNSPY